MKEWIERHDIITKILSVIAAVILWCYFVSVQNPVRTLEYKNISVQLTGVDELNNSYNLQVISGADETVDVKVSASSTRLASLTASQIEVKADVSESITAAGTYEVSYEVILPESGMTCVSRSPDTITVTVDRVETKTVPVSVSYSDDAPNGYIYEDAELAVDTVEITGPESELNEVSSAIIEVDTDGLTSTLTDNFAYKLVDSKGNVLDTTNISRSVSSIGVTVPVKRIKTVPLEVTLTSTDEETDVTTVIAPSSVQIVGDPDTVEAIDSIVVGAINASTVSNGDTFDFTINAPTGVELADGEAAIATVTISIDDTSQATYTTTDISLNDTDVDETATVTLETTSLEVTLSGSQTLLDTVSTSDISAVAEIASADLSDGRHTIGATISSPDGTTVIGTYSVTISIERESEESSGTTSTTGTSDGET